MTTEHIDEIRRQCQESQIRSERRRLAPKDHEDLMTGTLVVAIIFIVTTIILLLPR